MAVAATMPWQQQLFGCFGGAPTVLDQPGLVREDSAHQHHSSGSSGLSRSNKNGASDSNGDLPPGHIAVSDPFPRRSSAAGPPSGGQPTMRSASIRVDRRASVDPASRHAAHARRHSSRHSSWKEEPRGPTTEPEDWHRLKRFAFVGDICSNRGAGTVTKLMLNRQASGCIPVVLLRGRSCISFTGCDSI